MNDTWHGSKARIEMTVGLPLESYKYFFIPFIFHVVLSLNLSLQDRARAKKLEFPFGRRVTEVRFETLQLFSRNFKLKKCQVARVIEDLKEQSYLRTIKHG